MADRVKPTPPVKPKGIQLNRKKPGIAEKPSLGTPPPIKPKPSVKPRSHGKESTIIGKNEKEQGSDKIGVPNPARTRPVPQKRRSLIQTLGENCNVDMNKVDGLGKNQINSTLDFQTNSPNEHSVDSKDSSDRDQNISSALHSTSELEQQIDVIYPPEQQEKLIIDKQSRAPGENVDGNNTYIGKTCEPVCEHSSSQNLQNSVSLVKLSEHEHLVSHDKSSSCETLEKPIRKRKEKRNKTVEVLFKDNTARKSISDVNDIADSTDGKPLFVAQPSLPTKSIKRSQTQKQVASKQGLADVIFVNPNDDSKFDAEGYLNPLRTHFPEDETSGEYSYVDLPELVSPSKSENDFLANRPLPKPPTATKPKLKYSESDKKIKSGIVTERMNSEMKLSPDKPENPDTSTKKNSKLRFSGVYDAMFKSKASKSGKDSKEKSLFYCGIGDSGSQHVISTDDDSEKGCFANVNTAETQKETSAIPADDDFPESEPYDDTVMKPADENKCMSEIEPITTTNQNDLSLDFETGPKAPPRRRRGSKQSSIATNSSLSSPSPVADEPNREKGPLMRQDSEDRYEPVSSNTLDYEVTASIDSDTEEGHDYIYPEDQNPGLIGKEESFGSTPAKVWPSWTDGSTEGSDAPPPLPERNLDSPKTVSNAHTAPILQKLSVKRRQPDPCGDKQNKPLPEIPVNDLKVDVKSTDELEYSTNEYSEPAENDYTVPDSPSNHIYDDPKDLGSESEESGKNETETTDIYHEAFGFNETMENVEKNMEMSQMEPEYKDMTNISADLLSSQNSRALRGVEQKIQVELRTSSSSSDVSSDRPFSSFRSSNEIDYLHMDPNSPAFKRNLYINNHNSLDFSKEASNSDGEDIPSTLGKRQKKAFLVAKEIMTSEETFVDVLQLLDVDFRSEVALWSKKTGLPIIPPAVLNQILKYLPELLQLNLTLLHDFKKAVEHWEENPQIADIFIHKGPFLKHYTSYISEYEVITDKFDEAMKHYPDFKLVVEKFESYTRCANLTLKQYMIKPIQRIPQYRLLLQDYMKNLEEGSKEWTATKAALVVVSEVADHANESMKYGEYRNKLWEIQSKLVGQYEVIKPGRQLIKEGLVSKLSRKGTHSAHLFLLSDVLLYTSPVAMGYKLKRAIPLAGMMVDKPTKEDFKNEFTIQSPQRSFAVLARSNQEREDWISTLEATIKTNKEKRHSMPMGSHLTVAVPVNQGDDMEIDTRKLGTRAPRWVPDDRASMCALCTAEFTVTFRRHHCRACGKVYCGFCSDYRAPLRYQGYEAERVCRDCFRTLVEDFDKEEEQQPTPGNSQDVVDNRDSRFSKDSLRLRFRTSSMRKTKKHRPAVLQEVQAWDADTAMSGYLKLWKKRKWKKQWFVVKGKALYTFKASEDTAAIHSCVLLGFQISFFDTWFEGIEPALIFKLRHRGMPDMIFRTESLDSRENWISALRSATLPD